MSVRKTGGESFQEFSSADFFAVFLIFRIFVNLFIKSGCCKLDEIRI